MPALRLAGALLIVAAGHCFLAARGWAARPAAEEMALRDRWVTEHFPTPPAPARRLLPLRRSPPRPD